MAALLRSSRTIVSRNLLRSLSSVAGDEKPAATSLRMVKSALISESDPDKLFEIFQKSSDHPRVWRDRTVFDVSVRKLSRSKRFDLIEKILEHQKVSPVAKTEGFLVRIMMLYSNAGMFDQAVRTFHQMGELGYKRTEKSFCALLSVYLQKGQFDLVHKSFESVPKEIGISPGVSAYNHVLKALCKEKSFDSARSLLEKMEKEKGVTPDTASYNILLGACLENGDETKFNEFVKEMEKKGLNPSLVTYNYRISKLVRNKESSVDDAKKMFDEMVSKNIRPNSDTYVALIRHFVQAKDFDSALGICKESLRRRYVPPFSSVKDLVNGLVKSSKADEAKKIVENTKELLRGSAVDSWAKFEGLLPLWHKDGKIRSWKMEQALDATTTPFKEGLTWRAHRGPVLSMAMTCYGDLWSGSEGGTVKVWPWEAIEKTFNLSVDEKHLASLLVERSFIDLRSQVTVNGVCSISGSDVKYLLSDNPRAKVWSAGYLSFSLWDARTRELLKVFNVDGQIENRVDMSTVQDTSVEDEMKVKFVSSSKKEKSQGLSFFQRSRNALMGAADAVRRVAVKGAFGDDNRRTEAMVLTVDGMIWTGCTNGSLVQWDGNGNRVQDFNHHSSAVQCLCSFGSRIWVGYVSGTVHVLDLEGYLLGGWVAHSSPVIKIAIGAGYIFTLANQGGIRGWNITSPGPLDNILRTELSSKAQAYAKLENMKILTGTWNVGQGRASHDSLILWLGSAASDVGIVVVGLQEVEMGAGFLAMSAARETVGLEGSSIGQWWIDMIGKTLDEGTTFELVGSRQLAGLLIAIWVRKNLRPNVGDVDAAAVPCGFGRAIGNKGAVGLRMRVYDRIICFSNCHLAAHLEAVSRRNADFDHIYRTMTFNRPNLLNAPSAGGSSAVQTLHGPNAVGIHSEDGKPELSEADMVVFLGDFNYRLYGITYEEAKDHVSQRCFDWLRERDQLRAEMKSGKVFQGMREGIITFPPTYKFQKHQVGLGGYDSSEKKRIPAWCDRILYRDSCSATVSKCSLECPIMSSILQYEACMDVTDSDHKPVRCIYNVDITHIDESLKRQEFGEIIRSNEKIRSLLEELCYVPETRVSMNNIVLQNHDKSILQITNKCDKEKAMFEIICIGLSSVKEDGEACEQCTRGSFGFPRWLQVIPAAGVIKPRQIAEVSINHEEFHTLEEFVDGIPQNWWCEDTRDKEAMLVLCVRGSRSSTTKAHQIHVCHSFASKSIHANSRSSTSRRFLENGLQSDL